MSFRWKTILGIGLIEVFFLSLLIWQASNYLQTSNQATMESRARDTLMLASSVITQALIAVDLAKLEEQASQILKLDGVEYVRIKGFDRVLVAKGTTADAVHNPDQDLASVADGTFDQQYELTLASQSFGSLELGMSVQDLKQTLAQAQVWFYSIALAELVLVGLCSWILANYLIRRLGRLRDAANTLAAGGYEKSIPVEGDDELAETLKAFNTMAQALQERESRLQTTNKRLLESNQILLKREQELMEATELAEQASQAKSRFLSHMSHEIRSPLNAVLGSLTLIADRAAPDSANERLIQLACSSGNVLLRVVDEILDFSRIEAGHVRFESCHFSLRVLLDELQETLAPKEPSGPVILIKKVSEWVPSAITSDRDHIAQVLTILLDNALKFTPEGEVVVTADVESLPGEDQCGWLLFEVRDTGPGIPEEQLDRIFLEFEQVDPVRDAGFGGAGLGLTIARNLIEGMGGNIRVESQISSGTAFFIRVPFYNAETPEGSGTAGADSVELIENSLTVLLVDDVDANLFIGSEMLKIRGFCVDQARDGVEAVAMASARRYDAILMDMRMPRMNGLDATRSIRQSGGASATVPIIAVSANAEQAEMERCKEAGLNDFVSKPYDLDRLVSTINRHVTYIEEPMTKKPLDVDDECPILSDAALEQLASDVSIEALPAMLAVFLDEVRSRLGRIETEFGRDDEAELREQAHAMKSCAGTYGGLRLQAAASALEDAAIEGRVKADPHLMSNLKQAAEQTLIDYHLYKESL